MLRACFTETSTHDHTRITECCIVPVWAWRRIRRIDIATASQLQWYLHVESQWQRHDSTTECKVCSELSTWRHQGFFPTLWMYTCWCNSLCSRWTVCTKHSQDILTSVSPSLAIRYPWDVGRDSEYSSKPAAWEMCFSTDTTFVVDDESKQRPQATHKPRKQRHWDALTISYHAASDMFSHNDSTGRHPSGFASFAGT